MGSCRRLRNSILIACSWAPSETGAFAKVLIDDGSGKILGAHMVGHGAEEVIHLFAFAMEHEITGAQLANTVYAYPTFASDIKYLV